MKAPIARLRTILGGLAIAAGAAACAAGADSSDGRLRVVTTTGIVGDAAMRVGGDRVNVTSLMGPGIDPHLYRASEGDVSLLSNADLVLFNGLHLEAKMGEVLEQMGGRVTTVAVSEKIDRSTLLAPPEFAGNFDPHIWFDVRLWMQAVERIRDALIAEDSAGAATYQANAKAYLEELGALDDEVRAKAQTVPAERRVVITAHDAFNYFGRAYGFEVRGLQGISTAAEAGTADVQALAQFIVARRIPAIFVESSVSPRTIEAVQAAVRARGFGVKIGGQLYSDALGNAGTPAGTYPGMVRANVQTITAALSDTATAVTAGIPRSTP